MGSGAIDMSYLSTVVSHLTPIMNRALPLVGTGLVLSWLLSIIKK